MQNYVDLCNEMIYYIGVVRIRSLQPITNGAFMKPTIDPDLDHFLDFWSPVIPAEIIRRGGDAKMSFFVFEKIHPDMTMREFDKLLQEAVKCS